MSHSYNAIPQSGFATLRDFAGLGIPYKRSSIYRMIQEGRFPPPIKLSASRSVWRVSDLVQWVEAQAAKATPYTPDQQRSQVAKMALHGIQATR